YVQRIQHQIDPTTMSCVLLLPSAKTKLEQKPSNISVTQRNCVQQSSENEPKSRPAHSRVIFLNLYEARIASNSYSSFAARWSNLKVVFVLVSKSDSSRRLSVTIC
ncbi:hypothetical protein AABB24_003585, partial [Solanum stoloniferum]